MERPETMTEYELKNEQLTILAATKGGALSSIRDHSGLEYLWQGDAAYWTGQAPILFPICGSIRGDRAQLPDGRAVSMPRHGIVRKREFRLESSGRDFLTFEITADEEMKKQFPFAFRLLVTYTLDGNRITVTFCVENRDTKEMPFTIGGHPGFNCPLLPGEQFSDYQVEFEQTEHCSVPQQLTQTGLLDLQKRHDMLQNTRVLPLDFSLFEQDAITFDQLRSHSVRLCNQKTGHGVQLDFADFPYLILWTTANHGPFLAMEPWAGLSTCTDESDQFAAKRNTMFVKPGEQRKLSFYITIL